MFKVLAAKLLEIPFLRRRTTTPGDPAVSGLVHFTEDDDLDMALYHLRALANIFRWAPDHLWAILARKTISPESRSSLLPALSEFTPLHDKLA